MLTKSDFIKYIQCKKYLWLCKNRKNLLPIEVDENLQHIFDDSYKVESYAYKLFPSGVNAGDDDIPKAIRKTTKLMAEKTEVIFQPTVAGKDLFCRADIIKFNSKNQKWDIYEVKNTTEIKDIHLYDVAFQKMAFEKAGYSIDKTHLVHINNKYVRKGELEIKKLFKIENISQDVKELENEIRQQTDSALEILKPKEEPIVRILKQCSRPFDCAFIDYCHKDISENSIYSIAGGLNEEKLNQLLDEGVIEMKDIPEGVVTSKAGLRHYKAVKTQQVHIEKENIRKELAGLKHPLYFLDYETNAPSVPLFDGYSPYQRMIFQYSLHVQETKGSEMKHYEYLAQDLEDPSLKLAEALSYVIGKKGSVIVWNKGFEKGCNKEMGERYPEFAKFFESVNRRVYDLMDSFKKGYYVHYDFQGGASIKKVLPVLVPKLSYKELNIQEGVSASNTWLDTIKSDMPQKEKDKVYNDLLKYCELDTLAMVEILNKMREL